MKNYHYYADATSNLYFHENIYFFYERMQATYFLPLPLFFEVIFMYILMPDDTTHNFHIEHDLEHKPYD